MMVFTIDNEYIQLIQLLKAARIAQSGGDAQRLVESGLVYLNGAKESRKRAKVRSGDVVKCGGKELKVIGSEIV